MAFRKLLALVLALAPLGIALGDDETASIHFQSTVADQYHPAFRAAYSGTNSQKASDEQAISTVTDLFMGVRLWRGAEAYLQPELSGGSGLSSTLGIAAFTSGEVYRVGNPAPSLFVGRAFLRQTIGLGGPKVKVEPSPNQVGGSRDANALTLTLGKVSVPDFVDNVPNSNDPHTEFSCWGLFASAAYDYPADTHGYDFGAAADLTIDWWSVRGGIFLEPTYANGNVLDWRIDKARGLVAEYEGRFDLLGRSGAARFLGFFNVARMGSYALALAEGSPPNIVATRADGRRKVGFAASMNQELADGLSGFLRLSYNDGANETWAFTEIDRSFAVGVELSGSRFGREADEVGAGFVLSGLSDLHRKYLAAGGYGFIIGDGALSYSPEFVGEIYYRAAVTREVSATVRYQPVLNPAYNSARGPVHVFTASVHVAF